MPGLLPPSLVFADTQPKALPIPNPVPITTNFAMSPPSTAPSSPSSPSSPKTALNIIIPIGGIGSRFSKMGYRYPKPLINIIGRPMILRLIDNLSMRKEDTLWMAVNAEIDDEFRIGQLVMKSFPELDFRLLRLRHQTKGASETLYITTQSMGKSHMGRRTVSLDCDTIYWADILQNVRDIPVQHGAVFYFPDDGLKPVFSYIKTEEHPLSTSPKATSTDSNVPTHLELITDIREKIAISNKANTGAYVFATAELLHTWAGNNIDSNALRPDVGEYYTSQMIGTMIHDAKLPFLGLKLGKRDFSCVGTPEQLEELLMQMKFGDGMGSGKGKMRKEVKKRRFCFDLDNTLVGAPNVVGDYSTCPPILKNIRLVQQLHRAGHYIIIQTARRMRTHHGNVGAILRDVGPVTFAQLDKYEIPYHDIHFGKPWADIYVDDLAVHANLDTMKEIGWLLDEADPSSLLSPSSVPARPTTPLPSQNSQVLIAARDFNTIQIVGSRVIKSSKSEAILGELYFYAHMPSNLSRVFPTVFAVDYLPETGNSTLEMEYRQGLTFTHLLVGRSLTEGRLLKLLNALHSIHMTTPGKLTQCLPISPALAEKFARHSVSVESVGEGGDGGRGGVNIYANYGLKLRSRYYNNASLYTSLGPSAAECFSRLNEFLDTYEAEDRGVHVPIIHGDPVLSNAILSPDNKHVSFIDVRCQLENTLTMEGDLHYDLAKILQSLLGYDHILFMDLASLPSPSAPLLEDCDERILEGLQDVFWAFLEAKYAVQVHRKTLLRITASLIFSLIPLHKRELGEVFLRFCLRTLEMAKMVPWKRTGSGMAFRGVDGVGESMGEGEVVVEMMGEKRAIEKTVAERGVVG